MEHPREIRFSHAGRAPAGTIAVCSSLCHHSILEGYSFYTTDPPNFEVHADCTRQYLPHQTAAATAYGRNTSFAPPDNSRSLNPGSHFGHSPSFPPYQLLYCYPYHYPSYDAQPLGYGPTPPPPPPPPHHGHWNSVFYAPAQPQHGYAPAPPPPPHHHHNDTWTTVTNTVQESAIGAFMQTLFQYILSTVLSN